MSHSPLIGIFKWSWMKVLDRTKQITFTGIVLQREAFHKQDPIGDYEMIQDELKNFSSQADPGHL